MSSAVQYSTVHRFAMQCSVLQCRAAQHSIHDKEYLCAYGVAAVYLRAFSSCVCKFVCACARAPVCLHHMLGLGVICKTLETNELIDTLSLAGNQSGKEGGVLVRLEMTWRDAV